MLSIMTLPLGAYQTNCYILRCQDSRDCCVIDPGYEADTIRAALKDGGLNCKAILLTHGHFDHVGAVRELAADLGCRVYISEKDLHLPKFITAGAIYYTDTYPDAGTLELAGMTIRILSTPGHTPGSVCLLVEDAMFSGDTLFAGSCGRTDLPGGSRKDIAASLSALAALPGNYRVFPGHGNATTLDHERQSNPYL